MIRRYCFWICYFLIAAGSPAFAQDSLTPHRHKEVLEDLSKKNQGSTSESQDIGRKATRNEASQSFTDFTVTVEAEIVQSRRSGGLFLSVRVHNDGNRDVMILNPLDFCHIYLADRVKEQVISLPVIPSRFHSHSINLKDSRPIRLPFQFHHPTYNGQEMTEEEIQQFELLMKSQDSFEVVFEVDRILDKSVTPPKESEIPPGEYWVILEMSLHAADDFHVVRNLKSDLIGLSLIDEPVK